MMFCLGLSIKPFYFSRLRVASEVNIIHSVTISTAIGFVCLVSRVDSLRDRVSSLLSVIFRRAKGGFSALNSENYNDYAGQLPEGTIQEILRREKRFQNVW